MTPNILVLNWQDISNPLAGGAEVHLHQIFKRIAAKNYHVILGCCSYENAKINENIDGIDIIRRGRRNVFNFIVPGLYKSIRSKYKIDIVIDDINKIPFYTPLYVKEPIVGIVHHLFGKSIFSEASLPGAVYVNLSELLIPYIYKNVPISVVSNSTRQELLNKGLSSDKMTLVQNGVDLNHYKINDTKRSETPLIGYLGRIKKYKNIDHALKAFVNVRSKLPDIRMIIIGDGDYIQNLKNYSASLGLANSVEFTGMVSEEKKVDLLNKLWFTINPSSKEGWGLTVIESNACGLPVVAADSPGLRDSVVHEKTGLLYPHGNINTLTDYMITLVKNEKLRNTLSENAIGWSREFDWDNSANQMLHLIENVLN